MNKLEDVSNYLDLAGLHKIKAQSKADPQSEESKGALKKAAQHFESIFIGMMLKSMRDANAMFEEGNPMHSNTTKFFRDMYDSQLATDMAMNGSMGLADIIVEQLSGDAESHIPASILRNDTGLTRPEAKVQANDIDKTLVSPDTLQASSFIPSSISSAASMPLASDNPSLLTSFNKVIDKSFADIGAEKPSASELNRPIKTQVEFESPKDFITSIWGHAKKAAAKIGVNPMVMVAQSALETGWGKHIIKDKNGDSSFNLFNVKAHRDWTGEKAAQSTLEFEQGVAVRKVEPFRVYNNFTEAFDDFVNFLKSNNRYESALEKVADSEQFLQKLQQAGYATDPKYAEKILNILKSDRFKDVVEELAVVDGNNIGA